jgi:hypothetical protein
MRTLRFAVRLLGLLSVSASWLVSSAAGEEEGSKKRVVFIAGGPSHNYGAHEPYAGSMILANALRENVPQVEVEVVRNGWPEDDSVLDGAATVVIYADGGAGHPVIPHLERFDKLAEQGVGLMCIHYGVEVPKGEPGDKLLDWIGG